MWINPAYAQTAGTAAEQPSLLMSMIPFILIFVIFYFLLIRPQQKRLKEHQMMVDNLRRGDKIVTGGGIMGTVSRIIDEKEITVDIADGVTVHVMRATISTVLSKPEPASQSKPTTANDDAPAASAAPKKPRKKTIK